MIRPDPLSLRVAQPFSRDEIERIRSDEELRAELDEVGGNLDEILSKLRLPASRRLGAEPDSMHILNELRRREIRFVVIGGLAARVYGSTHSTSDVDICHARDFQNLRALAQLLKDLKAEYRRTPQFALEELHEKTLSTEYDFVFNTPFGKFDLIGNFTGVGMYAQAHPGAISVEIGRINIPVLALPKLLDAKSSTGRPKDTLVAAELDVVMKVCQALQRPAVC